MPARTKAVKKVPARRTPANKPAAKQKRPAPRLPVLDEDKLTTEQRALLDSIRSGPRGASVPIRGPFAVFLHAPAYGQLAQTLGGYLRYQTGVPPRLSEFAILCTARLWRAQYEWFAHEPQAERAGVKPATIRDLHAGRVSDAHSYLLFSGERPRESVLHRLGQHRASVYPDLDPGPLDHLHIDDKAALRCGRRRGHHRAW